MDAPEDFEALVEREYGPLVRVASVILGDATEAQEVVQEAFTRALVRWTRVRAYDRPGAWLRLVTVRLALRGSARRARLGTLDGLPNAGAEDRHRDADLERAIHGLPDRDRAVIVLHYFCDLPVDEVARIVRSRPGAVKTRLHRARARLAEALEVDDVSI